MKKLLMRSPFYYALVAFLWTLHKSPRVLQKIVVWGLAFLAGDILRLRRALVIENIKRCFPRWSSQDVKKVAKASYKNQAQIIVDFANMLFMEPSEVLTHCSFENRHILEKALEQKRGVILLGCHLSNGDYGIAALAQSGVPTYLVAKRFSNASLDELLYRARHRFGTKSIAPRRSSFDILKALKNNAVVIFVLDQFMGPPLGLPTRFFGHPTGTAMGLALFAEKTQAPVVPCYTYRKTDGSYCVRFEAPIPFIAGLSKDESLQKMTQIYNDHLEKVAIAYPEQWLWLHRRWKVFQ